jgi:polyisoprenoid-binding protein YceI
MTTDTSTIASPSVTGDYDIDPAHSRLGFSAKHAMVTSVRGVFTGFTAQVHLDEENVAASSARIEIEAASVDTGNADRDAHLRNEDFFDVEKFPTISFASTSAEHNGGDDFVLHGDLTIKGVSKPVSVEFERTGSAKDPWGNDRVGFEGRAKISRKDWGLAFNVPLDGGGVLVSDKITLEFDIAAVKHAAAA